ncbi:4-(cytidine 5'-diphospho)-2-C-methyl-D-erythritol kinase [Microbacterium sp. SYP-A9085]|uniref:4-(cytidine 5'-diphospho)-2-C-methyl-D-erythritol kinase n=1 Tax=Microbacterium sp. SYP-A9085 TaxID=2664454 RepID=UPI0013273D36|nr:4-(cytidine 5'-diphospho)-2-C-methyl-D-erythritol kinase [Microbacterium sp. SYP-A9085]
MSQAAAVERIRVRAPGKINVFFEVGAAGADGYHEVASAYQAVSAYEDVWASPSDRFTVEVDGTVDVSGVPVDDTNLAVRAARLLAAEIGYDGGVHLRVHKGVPVAGGMGGGSADAAAALLACDALWGAGLSSAQLQRIGAQLGADVPFALMGGTAVGTGRGEQLSPALARGRFDWVLVISDEGMSTPDVYDELDDYRSTGSSFVPPVPVRPAVFPPVLQALRQGDARMLGATAHNDLSHAALRLRPALDDIINLGLSQGALTGIVSGSGPTLAFLADDEQAAVALQVVLSAAGHETMHVHGPVPGARIIPT